MYQLLGSLGGLAGLYANNKIQRQEDALNRTKGEMSLAQAINNRMLAENDAALAKRQAEERAAESEVYDPSDPMNVGTQAVNRVDRRNNLVLEGVRRQETLAGKQLSQLKKMIQGRRQQYYANMALHLLGAGFGAYNMFNTPAQYTDFERQAAQQVGTIPGMGLPI